MSGDRIAGFARVLLSIVTIVACSGHEAPTESSGGTHLPGSGHFVSPAGSARASGSAADPWDLATALSGAGGEVQPGDTIWLEGGTYPGRFESTLSGSPAAPIIVRQYPGERATIDGSMTIRGRHTWYWDFEVANTDARTQDVMGIDSRCTGCRFIDLVIHDHSGNGLGMWSEGPDQEAYGNIIYNNGFRGQNAGQAAHGIYAQNRTGTQRITDNIVFNQFGYGIHVYGSENSALNDYRIESNTSFDNGVAGASANSTGMDYQIGGLTPLRNLVFSDNNSYRNPSLRDATTARLGYDWGPINYDGTATDNYFVGTLLIVNWVRLDAVRNVVIDAALPTRSRVLVQPNRYEPGRANIIVYNWERRSGMAVDVSAVLQPGQRYEVRDVQDYFGQPVASGTYAGGTIEIPIRGDRTNPSITGISRAVTGIEFAAFVLLRR
jgi:hypothetical protein